MGFVTSALDYAKELVEEGDDSTFYPLDRLEPRTVTIDFIRWLTKDMERVSSNYYICQDETQGDNSDNGHFNIDLDRIKNGENLEREFLLNR